MVIGLLLVTDQLRPLIILLLRFYLSTRSSCCTFDLALPTSLLF
jgi:hypothetical protein